MLRVRVIFVENKTYQVLSKKLIGKKIVQIVNGDDKLRLVKWMSHPAFAKTSKTFFVYIYLFTTEFNISKILVLSRWYQMVLFKMFVFRIIVIVFFMKEHCFIKKRAKNNLSSNLGECFDKRWIFDRKLRKKNGFSQSTTAPADIMKLISYYHVQRNSSCSYYRGN